MTPDCANRTLHPKKKAFALFIIISLFFRLFVNEQATYTAQYAPESCTYSERCYKGVVGVATRKNHPPIPLPRAFCPTRHTSLSSPIFLTTSTALSSRSRRVMDAPTTFHAHCTYPFQHPGRLDAGCSMCRPVRATPWGRPIHVHNL